MKRIDSIQYLRGVAALLVVLQHSTGRAYGDALWFGNIGVDIFFVISGFIMWLVGENDTPLSFILKRILRVAPLYWLATLLFVFLHPSPIIQTLKSLAFVPYRDAVGAISPLLTPGWTLNYEMFFYAAFAAVLFAPLRFRLAGITGVLAALVVVGRLHVFSQAPLHVYTSPLIMEFLAGIWLCVAWRSGSLPKWLVVAVPAGLVLWVALRAIPYVEDLRPIAFGIPAAFIVTGVLASNMLRVKLLKIIGDASYSIYLFHPFVIGVLWRFLPHMPPAAMVVVMVAVSAIVGVGIFFGLEQPLVNLVHNWRNRVMDPRPQHPGGQMQAL